MDPLLVGSLAYAVGMLMVYVQTLRVDKVTREMMVRRDLKMKRVKDEMTVSTLTVYVLVIGMCLHKNKVVTVVGGGAILALLLLWNLHPSFQRLCFVNEPQIDEIDRIRLVGRTKGFGSSETRRKMWPRLVNSIKELKMNTLSSASSSQIVSFQKDSNVIEADVKRSMFQFDVTRLNVMSKSKRKKWRNCLRKTLIAACERGEQRYYQGLHDVASVFLLVCGDTKGRDVVVRLARTRLKDYMGPDLSKPLDLLQLIYPLLRGSDPDLHKYMETSEVGTVFALSWFLTWFSHDLERLDTIARLFDFVLSSHPLSVVYIIVAMLRNVKSELKRTVPCDMASLISYLRDAPARICSKSNNMECVLSDANALMCRFPPSKLRKHVNEKNSWSVNQHFDSVFSDTSSSWSSVLLYVSVLLWYGCVTPLLCICSQYIILRLFIFMV